ncbi:MAG: DUF1611 domain-containing protein [Wenzhouxiangellaceae bacterium]
MSLVFGDLSVIMQSALVEGVLPDESMSKRRDTIKQMASAIVYCEGNFASLDGKTANGLIRHSEKYKVLSVIDSEKEGLDSGIVLDKKLNNIPICKDLDAALIQAVKQTGGVPDYFIFGMAPACGVLSDHERNLILDAMSCGMSIVNGLHEFLSDDPQFIAAMMSNNVEILDVRKPQSVNNLKIFSGRIATVNCPRIAILGTDCAIGKRTTATVLTQALNDHGIRAVMISTGQTGLIQGARYGVAIDAIPSQFCIGELESAIVDAYEHEMPDVIIIEGQGALSHPAFSSSAMILRGSCANAVILQHAPARQYRCDFEKLPMPSPLSEIKLIEAFSEARVIGMTINHENMTDVDVSDAIFQYRQELGLPVTDALTCSSYDLMQMVVTAFPDLQVPKKTAA